jgi:hypothetical protein
MLNARALALWSVIMTNAIDRAKGFLKRKLPSLAAVRDLHRHMRQGMVPVYLDYPVKPQPRYGWGKQPHAILNDVIGANRERYGELINQFVPFADSLKAIPAKEPAGQTTPYWLNGYVMGLDPVSLYVFPKLFASRLYLEIGSGHSTKFVRQSIRDNGLDTKIVSVDPHPRVEIDGLCDEIIRSPLEDVNPGIVDRLAAGDILMIDNSHRCFQNSDVEVTFMEVLPRLKPGVLIYIDDIYLPHDYPPEWARRYYSEQYLLGVLLMADARARYEVVFPTFFVCTDEQLRQEAEGFWATLNLGPKVPLCGNGFWMRVKHE